MKINITSYLKENWKALLFLLTGLFFAYTIAVFLIIQKESARVYSIDSTQITELSEEIKVGIVFGGGVGDDSPLPLLRDRLDTAKSLLDGDFIDVLLLSGDNRSLDYNEPAIMYNYLIDLGVDPNKLQPDYAGRSTYETCERAKKIFNVTKAFLISESTHLPRAVYLCRHFGVEAYGIQSDGAASSGLKIGQRWREVLARDKAVFNAYIIGENTVLGEPISL
jgi:vancomycin permeability regulator SanA